LFQYRVFAAVCQTAKEAEEKNLLIEEKWKIFERPLQGMP
jgi:hypothetical protein